MAGALVTSVTKGEVFGGVQNVAKNGKQNPQAMQIRSDTPKQKSDSTPDVTKDNGMPKRKIMAIRKEDPALLDKMNSDEEGVAGQFNGVGAFIDGYLRINKRRYGAGTRSQGK